MTIWGTDTLPCYYFLMHDRLGILNESFMQCNDINFLWIYYSIYLLISEGVFIVNKSYIPIRILFYLLLTLKQYNYPSKYWTCMIYIPTKSTNMRLSIIFGNTIKIWCKLNDVNTRWEYKITDWKSKCCFTFIY